MLGALCTQWVPETAPLDRKTSWFCFHTGCEAKKNTEFVGLLEFVQVRFHIYELSFTFSLGDRTFFGEVRGTEATSFFFLSSSSSSSGFPSGGAEGLFYLSSWTQVQQT